MHWTSVDERVLADDHAIGVNAKRDSTEGGDRADLKIELNGYRAVGKLEKTVPLRGDLASYTVCSDKLLAGIHVPNYSQRRGGSWIVGLKDSILHQEAMLLIGHIDPEPTNQMGAYAWLERAYRDRSD
jgi:hypothetical protein